MIEITARSLTDSCSQIWEFAKQRADTLDAGVTPYDFVLSHFQNVFLELLKDKGLPWTKDVYSRFQWPSEIEGPTLQELLLLCESCDGSGTAGFCFSWRCPSCQGSGFPI